MFQIEPVLWLQSLESPGMTWIMTTVTQLGYTPVYATLLMVLIFGIRLRHGLFVFIAMLIAGILTDGMKRGLTMPRPSDVDVRVIEPGMERPPLLVEQGGAASFWSLPSPEAMTATKKQVDWSYGFPSGHVASATAFVLGFAYFFRSKKMLVVAIVWIFLMALSRMYLGRHFIADVLGGMGVGVLGVGIGAYLVQPLSRKASDQIDLRSLSRWVLFMVPLVVLAPFIDILDKENIGRLLGLLGTYALLLYIGVPEDQGALWKRVARVLLALVVSAMIFLLVNPVMESLDIENYPFWLMITVFVFTTITFFGTIWVAGRLRLYDTS